MLSAVGVSCSESYSGQGPDSEPGLGRHILGWREPVGGLAWVGGLLSESLLSVGMATAGGTALNFREISENPEISRHQIHKF